MGANSGERQTSVCPQQEKEVVAAEDVVAVYLLSTTRRDEVLCAVVETETDAPEGVEEEEAMAFDASRATFRGFTFEDSQQVVIREVQYHMLGYGHTVWEAAIALAAWLRLPQQDSLVRGKEVLELGCGCALPGISTSLRPRGRPAAVTLSDMGDIGDATTNSQPWELLANARYNAATNGRLADKEAAAGGGCAVTPVVARIDWADAINKPQYANTAKRYPLIVGSDLLYEQIAIEPLVACIQAHLADQGTFIMMAPDSPALSRTELVAEFVFALKATGGSVSLERHEIFCYDSYADASSSPHPPSSSSTHSSHHPLQRITFTNPPIQK